mmetsp:Transcript_11897/g.10513  ORF Transcript_11897/g.10513 Transcript_11897/m.10513 type:complete len:111 (+) Transcript_11897:330-662(+)
MMSKKEKIPDDIRIKVLLFQKQKLGIESAIENEQVSFEKYMEFLNKSLDHDKILIDYFKQTGQDKKALIVKFRIECTEKELNQEVDNDVSDEEIDEMEIDEMEIDEMEFE